MKTIKIFTTVFAAMLLLVATEQAAAQNAQANQAVSIAAEVVGSLSFTQSVGELNFGIVGQNIGASGATSNPYVDPTVAAADENILDASSLTVAKYNLSGTTGQTVSFTYSNVTLTNSTKSLTYVPAISHALGDATTDNSGARGGALLAGSGSTVLLDSDTDITLWVGGELEEPDTNIAMVAGSYSGSLTITVDYVE